MFSVKLLTWTPRSIGNLLGFVEICIGGELIVSEIAIMRRADNTIYVGLPSKMVLGTDGQPVIDEATGKPKYIKTMRWIDGPATRFFYLQITEALRAAHPSALPKIGKNERVS